MLKLQKGRNRHRRHHNARMTGIQMAKFEKADSFRGMLIETRGGYSGWIRHWARTKPSAFERRFSPLLRVFRSWEPLPVRHPRIRFQGV